MRLLRLRLKNFRQHADAEILFSPGLTGIIGPNGAGKSTLLEAIAWAIYGAPAARGRNDTLRFNRAEPGSSVRVELELRLDDELYRIVRSLKGAELFLGEGLQPIASGILAVTEVLTRRLGMSREEFFHTYFTGQKELQFLATMKPTARALFLSQVLGYERLRAARDRARERLRSLKAEVQALQVALGDPGALAQALGAAEQKAAGAEAQAAEAEAGLAEATRACDAQEPRWREVQRKRERSGTLEADLRWAETEVANARKEVERAAKGLAELEGVEARLADLRRPLERLPEVEAEAERLAELKEAETTRAGLARHISDVTDALRRRAERIDVLEKTAAGQAKEAEAVTALKEEREKLRKERDLMQTEWVRERQEADTQLRTLGDRAKELKARIRSLEEAGPEGVCPTCQRPLLEEFGRVIEFLEGQLEAVAQDGRWWRKRQAQVEREPSALRTLEDRWARLERKLEAAETRLTEAGAAAKELKRERREYAERKEALEVLRGQLESLPEGYDAERHRALLDVLQHSRRAQEQVARLETRLEQRSVLQARNTEAEGRARAATERAAEAREELTALAYSDAEHEAARAAYEGAQAAQQGAALRTERFRAEAAAARDALAQARRAHEEHGRRAREIEERKRRIRLHEEVDQALGRLRDELNARVRPELSEIAGTFLVDLTDGRYNEIVIDDDYNLLVLDDGEPKPVLSGGEEDIANLVLRLAVSQMIAERAGRSLHLLIFDEIFGSLDEARRESVVRLLQRLQDRFEQVILITHVESIREGLDHVVRVRYDERSGASVISEERPETPVETLEPATT